jgi:hypothetical protein
MKADPVVGRSRMGDIEDRLGIRPIEELLHERQQAVEKVADLRAKHGSFGTWGDMRKSQLSTIKMRLRAEIQRDGGKSTEAALEDAAHADPGYTDLIITATQERARLTLLESRIEAIDMEIQRANAIARFCASEARL